MQLNELKGFGAKRIEKLNASGIFDVLDLLLLFPVKYYNKKAKINWSELEDNTEVIFSAHLEGKPVYKKVRSGLSFVRAKFITNDGTAVSCNWFNQDYILKALITEPNRIICGKIKRISPKNIEISAPQFVVDRDYGDILPVYNPPSGISQGVMIDAIYSILSGVKINGFIDSSLAEKYGLMELSVAMKEIHFPSSNEKAIKAKYSIALENLAYIMCGYTLIKKNSADCRNYKYRNNYAELSRIVANLPFQLTDDQKSAMESIIHAFEMPYNANILLYGDVGSGKTIIAFLSMLYAALSDYQAVLMSPTEVLAQQHYKNATEFFEPLGIKVAFLVGSQSSKVRAEEMEAISSGRAKIIIGTHAILGAKIQFHSLALTITDEQHRFGVCQRGDLENKSTGADNIVMSATPIPRTLALALYGQLTTVQLMTRPKGKHAITTALVPAEKINAMYEYVKAQALKGEKTYIVCPRVDSDEAMSATSLYDELKKGVFKDINVVLLHGKMKEKDKQAAMTSFAEGNAKIMIGTTVIEVGIDVKDASTIIIFGAERFGLSQLHQLRGRVGRDGRESYCFLVSSDGNNSERLKFFSECSDGFKLAEYDFNSRGAGEFFGTKQHGKSNPFAGVNIDKEMIDKAKAISTELCKISELSNAILLSVERKNQFIKSLSLS